MSTQRHGDETGDVPGTVERAGDHRSPEEEVEAAGDASRRALQDARSLCRREREDGIHERSCAVVSLMAWW